MSAVTLDISGMTCAACSARVQKVLARVDGVEAAEVNLALERADVTTSRPVPPERLIAAVRKAGYDAAERTGGVAERRARDAEQDARRRADERATLTRFAVSAALSIPLVVGTMPMMLGLGEPWIGPWTQAGLATGVMLACGSRFLREAVAAVRGGGANMAVLVMLGTGTAYLFSLWQVMFGHGHGHLYFEAAAVVLTLVMLGKWLEARARKGASAALHALARLQPPVAERLTAAGTETVAADRLAPGDRVRVRPGGQVPCDGVIVAGQSSLDESLITGESLPVRRTEGERVITGTVNGDGVLDVEVRAVGEDTRLARMTRLIEAAQRGDAPVQRLVDRISAVFVPAILAVAAATFAAWWLGFGNAEAGLVAAVSVLVIACPCALGLATPTALVAGTGAAARAGILIRDLETLERASDIATVAFDKTGTLTEGRPAVTLVAAADGVAEAEVLALAGGLEAASEHPLARALIRAAEARGIALPAAVGVAARPGYGLAGTVANHRVAVGTAAMMAAEGIAEADLEALRAGAGAALRTAAYVARDGVLAGLVGFDDVVRPEARAAVAALTAQGLGTVMLTGDNEAAASAIAADIGLSDVRARLLPEHKVAAIRDLAGPDGRGVAFVGDGLNDGPALAAARLGIALSSGTDVAREAAAVTLMRPDLRLVPAALDISRRTRSTIRQNLVWAFVYNVIGIPLAALGILSPVFAGAAMAFSSVCVVTNSAWLARWRPA